VKGWSLAWKTDPPAGLIDGSVLRPDTLCRLSYEDLARVRMDAGRASPRLGEIFDMDLGGTAEGGVPRLVVAGCARFVGLGAGMEAGSLEVEGDAGSLAGAGMRGGAIRVMGSAGHLAGAGMSGGLLTVEKSAGDLLGGPLPGAAAGMTGGEIIVHGAAGSEVGLRMRRGLIAVGGPAGDLPGHGMLAGTILVARGELRAPGIEMRCGSILGLASAGPPRAGFRLDGPVSPLWLILLLRRLQALGLALEERARAVLSGEEPLVSWSGDHLSLGRGEVLLPLEGSHADA
jgi:formylmethanofuran dehydrogenase subunit C